MNDKVFIVGLPRTGTTSVCVAALHLGFRTAHTAYTRNTFKNAQVIADTPVFNDYQTLSHIYPNSRFIYLERDLQLWLPSISQLLQRMSTNLLREDGGFNDTIKRCFLNTFNGLNTQLTGDYEYLTACYECHKSKALRFFEQNALDYLSLDISAPQALNTLSTFLFADSLNLDSMPYTNKGGKVTAWNEIRHPLKVSSTRNGKVDKDSQLYCLT
jgi:hypothetical protein